MKLGHPVYRGTIVVDVDGVLADFEARFCEAFGTDNRHLYSLEARYPKVDKGLIGEFVLNSDNYVDLAPIFGGMLFTRQAYARGWYILLVTSRDRSLRRVTRQWLEKYNVAYHELVFAKNKKEVITDYDYINPSRKVKIVIDDSVSNLRSMPEKYCVSWRQPWNVEYYPAMEYSSSLMGVMLFTGPGAAPIMVWDKVGEK